MTLTLDTLGRELRELAETLDQARGELAERLGGFEADPFDDDPLQQLERLQRRLDRLELDVRTDLLHPKGAPCRTTAP